MKKRVKKHKLNNKRETLSSMYHKKSSFSSSGFIYCAQKKIVQKMTTDLKIQYAYINGQLNNCRLPTCKNLILRVHLF